MKSYSLDAQAIFIELLSAIPRTGYTTGLPMRKVGWKSWGIFTVTPSSGVAIAPQFLVEADPIAHGGWKVATVFRISA